MVILCPIAHDDRVVPDPIQEYLPYLMFTEMTPHIKSWNNEEDPREFRNHLELNAQLDPLFEHMFIYT